MNTEAILKLSTVLCLIMFTSLATPYVAHAVKDDDISEALKMTRYDKDTAASAIIVSDIGSSHFNFDHPKYGIELLFERRILVRIFTQEGYDWADFFILNMWVIKSKKMSSISKVLATIWSMVK
ncbi:MAG: hypothetical protein IPL46_10295 [Saprospiraceae bacterium]|nr:hypothetical protein [Saprospiraceae bacterium]